MVRFHFNFIVVSNLFGINGMVVSIISTKKVNRVCLILLLKDWKNLYWIFSSYECLLARYSLSDSNRVTRGEFDEMESKVSWESLLLLEGSLFFIHSFLQSLVLQSLIHSFLQTPWAWAFSCKFAAYFQNTCSKEHLWRAASETALPFT